jgi:hypothetical protein
MPEAVRIVGQHRERPVYPFSIIRGGAYNANELKVALQTDPLVAQHYEDFRQNEVRFVKLRNDRRAYVSFRLKGKIYWTRNRIRLSQGETLLTDGENYARARCGNRVSETPRQPTTSEEPRAGLMDAPETSVPDTRQIASPIVRPPRIVPEVFPAFDLLAAATSVGGIPGLDEGISGLDNGSASSPLQPGLGMLGYFGGPAVLADRFIPSQNTTGPGNHTSSSGSVSSPVTRVSRSIAQVPPISELEAPHWMENYTLAQGNRVLRPSRTMLLPGVVPLQQPQGSSQSPVTDIEPSPSPHPVPLSTIDLEQPPDHGNDNPGGLTQVTPEPASALLILSGIAVFAIALILRRRGLIRFPYSQR